MASTTESTTISASWPSQNKDYTHSYKLPNSWEQNFEVIRRKGTIVPTDNASGTGPPFSLKLAAKDLKGVRPVYVDRHPTDLELTAWFGMTFLLRPSVASEEGEP